MNLSNFENLIINSNKLNNVVAPFNNMIYKVLKEKQENHDLMGFFMDFYINNKELELCAIVSLVNLIKIHQEVSQISHNEMILNIDKLSFILKILKIKIVFNGKSFIHKMYEKSLLMIYFTQQQLQFALKIVDCFQSEITDVSFPSPNSHTNIFTYFKELTNKELYFDIDTIDTYYALFENIQDRLFLNRFIYLCLYCTNNSDNRKPVLCSYTIRRLYKFINEELYINYRYISDNAIKDYKIKDISKIELKSDIVQ